MKLPHFIQWPYYSKKYLQLALIWSFIVHVLLIFFTGSTPGNSSKVNTSPSIQTVVLESKVAAPPVQPEVALELPPDSNVQQENQDQPLANETGSGLIPSPVAMEKPPEPTKYDTPAIALNPPPAMDIDDLPEKIDYDKPLIAIKIWIDATGLVRKTEIVSTQLDEFTSKKMAVEIGSQVFTPAIKDGKGVPSTKIYITGGRQ